MAAKEAIFVLRAGARRDSLDEGPDTAGTETRVDGCTVVPLMQTGEETFAAQIVTADYFVKAPPGTDLLATDQVRIRGYLCEVEGVPADFGRKGILFQARRVGEV
jgi:hypothetical protein